MIKIIGWLLVSWLLGSTIYSTKFHLGNYLREKQEIINTKKKENKKIVKFMHKQMNWGVLVIIQIIKAVIAIFILYFLLK